MTKIALLHISDIHFQAKDNKADRLIPLIAGALPPSLASAKALLICVSGDIAFSGKPKEYERALRAFSELKTQIDARFPSLEVLNVITSPGNHDCDFSLSTSVRDALIKQATIEADAAYVEAAASVQAAYRAFVESLKGTAAPAITSAARDEYDFELEGRRIKIVTLNSAWMSSLDERPGALVLPRCCWEVTPNGEALMVAMFHHPYSWYDPETSSHIKTEVERRFDIVITGHEHSPDLFKRVRDTGTVEYLEGDVFQEKPTKADGNFRLVEIDLRAKNYSSCRFRWDEKSSLFKETVETSTREFLRNAARTRNEFILEKSAEAKLLDLGDAYLHPHKELLTIDDVFVAPDCTVRRLSVQIENAPRRQYGIDAVLAQKCVTVVAPEAAGKTIIAKKSFFWLRERGLVPAFLTGEDVTSADAKVIEAVIETTLERTYGADAGARYRTLTRTQRAVVIDNFDRCALAWKERIATLTFLTSYFDVVILTSSTDPLLDLAITGQEGTFDTAILDRFHLWQVQELGRERRYELITRWCLAGVSYAEDEQRLQRTIVDRQESISSAVARKVIPVYPIFVLLCLQQLDASQKLEVGGGTFGYLYESFLTNSLARVVTKVDLDLRHNFLCEFANHLLSQDAPEISFADFAVIVDDYNHKYDTSETADKLLSACAPLLWIDHGCVRFKHKYAYFYYVARYLRDNLALPQTKDAIRQFARDMHLEVAGNVLMFLCHLSKDPSVIDEICSKAESLFNTSPPAELKDAVKQLGVSDDREVALVNHPVEQRRRELYRTEDAIEEHVAAHEGLEVQFISDTAAAFRSVQVLGQVLRGFHGSLPSGRKKKLAAVAYSLALRTVSAWFSWARENHKELLVFIDALLQHRNHVRDPSASEQEARRFIVWMLEGFTTYNFQHVAESLGREALTRTFDGVLEELGTQEGVRLIDLAIRIQTSPRFPEVLAKKLWDEHPAQISRNIIRNMVLRHLYLFPVEPKQRQRLCEKFKIKWVEPTNRGTQLLLDSPRAAAERKRGRKAHKRRGR